MSLTQDDLLAIKNIVETAVDDSDQRTAAGFAEVHERIDNLTTEVQEVKNTVERIERRQEAETERLDEHGKDIALLKTKLKLA